MPPVSDTGNWKRQRKLKFCRKMLAMIGDKVVIMLAKKYPQEQVRLGAEAGTTAGHVQPVTRSMAAKAVGAMRDAIASPGSPFSQSTKTAATLLPLSPTPNDNVAGKPPTAPPKSGQERTES